MKMWLAFSMSFGLKVRESGDRKVLSGKCFLRFCCQVGWPPTNVSWELLAESLLLIGEGSGGLVSGTFWRVKRNSRREQSSVVVLGD